MRAFMIVAFATMLFFSAWANNVDIAGAGQTSASTNPVGMMKSATGLPIQPGY
jgi:hypothetical protein